MLRRFVCRVAYSNSGCGCVVSEKNNSRTTYVYECCRIRIVDRRLVLMRETIPCSFVTVGDAEGSVETVRIVSDLM